MSDKERQDDQPESFGRFNVTGVLGRGGMGVVYDAQDPIIGRRVAIKVLRPDPALNEQERRELQSRFEQEFRSAGTLSHPNVVTIYDVGKGEDETAFIAMECIEGESLADLIASGRVLSFNQVAELAMQLCSALDYAHEAGIVHRDMKPANILITPEGRPKITDYGVAKVVSANLTRTGTVIGTPTYMSPEQVTGQPVTGATDQWAMAVILYQMLTGELPFAGESPTTILYKIVHQDPIPPHALNRSLPEAVDRVLLQALSKSPAERHASCIAMAEALRSALGAAPMIPAESTARTVTLSQSDIDVESGTYGGAASWWQRQKTGPRLGIVAAGAILVAATGWWLASLLAGDGTVTTPPTTPAVTTAAAPFESVFSVDSGVPGAAIFLDGEDTGKRSPAVLRLQGNVGDSVRIELRRHARVVAEESLVLGPTLGQSWEPREEPLPPQTFQVTSNPPGATVSVNGERMAGTTPLDVDLEFGESYRVVVGLEGFENRSWSFDFPDTLNENQLDSRQLPFNLSASIPPGAIVARAPYEVILEAGGRRAGPSSSPRLELPPGEYDLTVTAPSVFYYAQRPGVTVESGEVYEIPTFPEVHQINVASYPATAEVYIDGDLAGEVPLDVRLTIGTHDFLFRFPDGSERRLDRQRITRSTDRIFGER